MTDQKIFFAKGTDPHMIAAFQKAQETFKYFWRELSWEYRRIIPALTVACVKVAFTQQAEDSDEPAVEHMWVNNVNFDGNTIKGVLINSPRFVTNVANGDAVEVPLHQISDWLFAFPQPQPKGPSKLFSSPPKPKAYGGFTIQSMRSQMGSQERKAHDSAWGLDFGDYNDVLLAYQQKEHPENLVEHPMSKSMGDMLTDFVKKNPAQVNTADSNGYTLLHREAIAGNLTAIEILLKAGADKNAKTPRGETALDFARKLNWEHIIPVLS